MKKKILAALLAATMVLSLTACGGKEEPASNQGNEQQTDGGLVGVAMPTKDLQRWNQDGSNMKEKLEAAGYTVDLQYANNDNAEMVKQIENMIANGCKVLVVASIDGNAIGTAMEQAAEAGIKVIAYDRLIMNSPAVSYYATFDNYLIGKKQGEYIEDKLDLKNAGDKTYNIEFITGDPGDNNVNFFFGGAMDVLKPYLDSGVLKCPSGETDQAKVSTPEWSSEKAQARFDNILGSYYQDGTKLDAVLASNDSTAQGVAASLEANYTGDYPVLTGQDCDIVSVKNMIAGKQSMSIFKDTRTLAEKVVGMVDAIMKGNEPEVNDTESYDNGDHVVSSYLCEPQFADIDNYKELLVESGYYSEDELK